MSGTFWMVVGMAIGVTCAIIFYEQELRSVERERERYKRHVKKLAQEYGEQTIELERLRARS